MKKFKSDLAHSGSYPRPIFALYSMQSTLRQIGNDRCIIIPASLLAECDITDRIDLSVENGCLIISPAKPVRAGWFENYQSEPDANAWEGITETPKEQEDWEW